MPDILVRRDAGPVYPALRGLAARFLAGSALGLVFAVPAGAQTIAAASTPAQTEQVLIEAQKPAGYKIDAPSITKLTEPLLETPQSIDTISQQELKDRAAINLNDALRNVPGISLGAGEFMFQGNNPSIRGFVARTDIFLDGMRDFGDYYRDPFNLEQVEVLEGPSSILFGRGSTGGVINQVSKMPQLQAVTEGTVSFGTDLTRRGTIDIDRAIPELDGAAFRIDAMGNQGDVAGRDGAKIKRFGLAPSIAFGLGTPTRLTLSYFHQSANDVPDYGIPWYFGAPAPVSRNNYYGFSSDYLNTDADVGTVKIEHDLAPGITIRDQFRDADYTREERITQAALPASVTPSTPLDSILVTRKVYSGHSQEQMLQNQTDIIAHFATGFVQHDLVAGAEVAHERSSPEFDNGANVPTTSLLAPDDPSVFSGSIFERFHADTRANSYGFYAGDTLKFGPQWDVMLGARWDSFNVQYRSQTYSVPPAPTGNIVAENNLNRTDEAPSYRAGVVYKPVANGSIYVTYGTSFNPSAENLSLLSSGETFAVSNEFLAPEKNKSIEAGTKWNLFGNKASLSGALFQITKDNARVPDPANPGFNVLDGEQRVRGFEVLAEGYLTPEWQISGGYDYLDGQLVTTSGTGAPPGSPLLNVPKNSFTVWTTYAFPMGFVIGGGAKYLDKRYAQTTSPILQAPSYWTFDAMAKYLITSNISVQLNVYNITNAVYYDQLHPHFVIPGSGRSALLTLEFKY
jgi:catecholate siderophore receptor